MAGKAAYAEFSIMLLAVSNFRKKSGGRRLGAQRSERVAMAAVELTERASLQTATRCTGAGRGIIAAGFRSGICIENPSC
jgi:hypothetical protein